MRYRWIVQSLHVLELTSTRFDVYKLLMSKVPDKCSALNGSALLIDIIAAYVENHIL